jgi:TonB-dependent SusC/RagA subfamily outer membrane receptor
LSESVFHIVFAVGTLVLVASCGASRTVAPQDRTLMDVGYGSVSREDNAMTVSEVKMTEMEENVYNDIFSYLRNKVPGVEVGNTSGAGDRPHIQIRGTRSILGDDGEPLFVVDGVEFPQVETIRPDEIYSVQVLKDSAASSYGSRGVNGVIVITTKTAHDAEERERKAAHQARRNK